jgi:hypothetical protein
MKSKKPILTGLLLLAAFRASANEATISAIVAGGTLFRLSDGSVFQGLLVPSSPYSRLPWDAGAAVTYENGSGGCKGGYWLTNVDLQQQICVHRSNEKIVFVQVVQTETVKEVIAQSSGFASALPIRVGSVTMAAGSGSGLTVSAEVVKVSAEDVVLNGQRVRLRCGSCHPLNPGDYGARLRGDKLWIVSYGMEQVRGEADTANLRGTVEDSWGLARRVSQPRCVLGFPCRCAGVNDNPRILRPCAADSQARA